MSLEQTLSKHIKDWYAHTDQDLNTYLREVVSEDEASAIQSTYRLFLDEQEAFKEAKENNISSQRWIYDVLKKRIPEGELVDGMDLEDYASSLVHTTAKSILHSTVPEEVDLTTVAVDTIPQLQTFFDSPLQSPEEKPIHLIAGGALLQYAKKKNLNFDPAQACLIATTGITTTKALYQVGTGQIELDTALNVLEEQSVAALATVIETVVPKAGQAIGAVVGGYIGQYVGNAPAGAKIGAKLGAIAGEFVATKAKPIAKKVMSTAGKLVRKVGSFISSFF